MHACGARAGELVTQLLAGILFSSISGFVSSLLALYPVEGGGGAPLAAGVHALWVGVALHGTTSPSLPSWKQ